MDFKHKDQEKPQSAAEVYAFEFQNSEPKHYTRMPNIIDHLTYDEVGKNGKVTVKKLSVYAKELYRIIRMTAADKGACWRTTRNLAELMNCSRGSVTNAKKELLNSFHQLDGKPLLVEKKCRKAKMKEGKTVNTSPSSIFTVTDIWAYNNAYMATLYFDKNTLKESEARTLEEREDEACPPNGRGVGACPPNDRASPGACPPGGPNKKTNNNNHLSKEQQPAASAAPVGFFDKKERLSPSDSYTSEEKELALSFLKHTGFKEGVASKLIKDYPYQDLVKASHYCKIQSDKLKRKGRKLDDPSGYFINCLKNRYWEKK